MRFNIRSSDLCLVIRSNNTESEHDLTYQRIISIERCLSSILNFSGSIIFFDIGLDVFNPFLHSHSYNILEKNQKHFYRLILHRCHTFGILPTTHMVIKKYTFDGQYPSISL